MKAMDWEKTPEGDCWQREVAAAMVMGVAEWGERAASAAAGEEETPCCHRRHTARCSPPWGKGPWQQSCSRSWRDLLCNRRTTQSWGRGGTWCMSQQLVHGLPRVTPSQQ